MKSEQRSGLLEHPLQRRSSRNLEEMTKSHGVKLPLRRTSRHDGHIGLLLRLEKNRFDVGRTNPRGLQAFCKRAFRLIGLRSEPRRTLEHGLLEVKVLESVESVVMDEHVKRGLLGKQVRRSFDRRSKPNPVRRRTGFLR
jgi:hypothetical protein